MKNLLKKHYDSIVSRGKITNETNIFEFLEKFDEESKELHEAYQYQKTDEKFIQESIDCICVLTNMLTHFNIDIEEALKVNINHQLNRKD